MSISARLLPEFDQEMQMTPPIILPRKTFQAPKAIRSKPNAEPIQEAMRVERTRSCVFAQMAARSTRPPSRGNAGTKLNRPSAVLIHAR